MNIGIFSLKREFGPAQLDGVWPAQILHILETCMREKTGQKSVEGYLLKERELAKNKKKRLAKREKKRLAKSEKGKMEQTDVTVAESWREQPKGCRKDENGNPLPRYTNMPF
ncbi:hypothetical protein PROFUN_11157 [Planoprotostelium fungivorum]|uniref:Uncharacterized protein n=1 Tax=Planoprotostelium fungivorum TaxID=1890364 RepID=A0A2P6NAM2_9EUKA|nr:hypothetical protein PROFUN_11157 [Planoprotostelium fungivorum]